MTVVPRVSDPVTGGLIAHQIRHIEQSVFLEEVLWREGRKAMLPLLLTCLSMRRGKISESKSVM